MATIGTAVTLMDIARRLGPDNKVARIIELLNQTNAILDDMQWVEGNLPTGHKTTVRTGLPSVAWRLLNYGVPNSKSQTRQVIDSCGMLEAYAEVDKRLADLNGNAASFRLSEDMAFIEAMNQEMASTIFYGSTATDPEKFNGLSIRYSDPTAENGENLVNGGGTGDDNTSIWLVIWGDQTCHGIYPKGASAGLKHEDLGEVTLEDADGGKYQGYRSHYTWDCGLTLRDWRYVVRICNLDVSALIVQSGAADLITKMVIASEIPNSLSMGRAAWYCNKTVSTYLRLQALAKTNVQLTLESVEGKPITMFGGIPIRRCDSLLNTESPITFA